MDSWIVETSNLKKYYRLGENTVKALGGVNFRVQEQELIMYGCSDEQMKMLQEISVITDCLRQLE